MLDEVKFPRTFPHSLTRDALLRHGAAEVNEQQQQQQQDEAEEEESSTRSPRP